MDVLTGFYDYGFRDYSPSLARFTTVDPIRDGSNWYSYVNWGPINRVDLWGLCEEDDKNNGEWHLIGDAYAGAVIYGAGTYSGIIQNTDTGKMADITIAREIIGLVIDGGGGSDKVKPFFALDDITVKNAPSSEDLLGKKGEGWGWALVAVDGSFTNSGDVEVGISGSAFGLFVVVFHYSDEIIKVSEVSDFDGVENVFDQISEAFDE